MSDEDLKRQKMKDGYGPVHHRVYSITLPVPFQQAERAMAALQADPNAFSPQILAKFEKTRGAAGVLHKDDEFLIHITGPWNGPVRVAEVSAKDFRLVTLDGHLEAGDIKFEIVPKGDGMSAFVIESLARSRDGVVDFVYDKVPIAKVAQTEMWESFCKKFAEAATGDKDKVGQVDLLIERKNEDGEWEKL